jgi:release factor glutamine methyltransferase
VTIRDALRNATALLEHDHISNARLNAEALLAHCLSVDRTYLFSHDDRMLTRAESLQFEEIVHERISGVPLQYIVGRQEFYGRSFAVNRSVLIPRPETEYAVEAVLQLNPVRGARIIDVGAGSGCIGVTLALELPEARVTLADISFEALSVARTNAVSLGASVCIVCMDLLDAAAGPFDFVVSNPPYVSPADASKLQREIREHEPHIALFAPDDGLDVIRRLVPAAARLLKPGGYFVAEIGFGMEERVLALLEDEWETLPSRKDLQGIPRIIVARRSR